ncbi:hypothetical protein [Enterococcus sp. AZ103]|uniref:hypothetical protein n=1 Tax=Enterococcus sp. AZ103 TaxID=2774628 RepID=UPI003F27FB57
MGWALIGAYVAEVTDFCLAAKLLSLDLIDPSPLIEIKFLQKDIQAAFEYASREGMYRVSLLMD